MVVSYDEANGRVVVRADDDGEILTGYEDQQGSMLMNNLQLNFYPCAHCKETEMCTTGPDGQACQICVLAHRDYRITGSEHSGLIAQLYPIEQQAKHCAPAARLALRHDQAKPLLAQCRHWLVATRLRAGRPPRRRHSKPACHRQAQWPGTLAWLTENLEKNYPPARIARSIPCRQPRRADWKVAGLDAYNGARP